MEESCFSAFRYYSSGSCLIIVYCVIAVGTLEFHETFWSKYIICAVRKSTFSLLVLRKMYEYLHFCFSGLPSMVIGIIFSFFWTFVDSICFSSYTGLLMFRCWALEEVYRTRAAPRSLTSTTCSGQYWCLYSPNPCCRNTDWKSIHLGSGNGSTHQVHQHHDGPRAHTVSTYSLGTIWIASAKTTTGPRIWSDSP